MKRGPIVTTASLTLTASLALTPTAALADGFRGGAGGGPGGRRPPGGPPFVGRPVVPPPLLPPPLGPRPLFPPLLPSGGSGAPPPASAPPPRGIGEPGARAAQPGLPLDGRARGDALDGSLGRGPAGVPRAGDTIPALLSRQAGGRAPIRRGCPA